MEPAKPDAAYDLVIHIGTHKTGTTAIQTYLRRSRGYLKKQGILFVDYPLPGCDRLVAQKELTQSLIDSHKKQIAGALRKCRSRNLESVLLSSEGFSGLPMEGYGNVDVIADHWHRIAGDLRVKIILYLRRQDLFAESLYFQRIRTGSHYTFEEFLDVLPLNAFDWSAIFDAYAKRFDSENVFVRTYDQARLKNSTDLLRDFHECLNIAVDESLLQPKSVTVHSGYSQDAMAFALLSNPGLDEIERKALGAILQEVSAKQPFEPYSFFSPDQRQAFLDNYASSNRQLAENHFGLTNDRLFSSPDNSTAKVTNSGLTVEKAIPIIAKAMVSSAVRRRSLPYSVQVLYKIEGTLIQYLRRFPGLKSWIADRLDG